MACNPLRVPSVKDGKGRKQPLCKTCHNALNEVRKELKLEPWPEPHPDAYEACDENELP